MMYFYALTNACILTTMCLCSCRIKSEKTLYNIEQNRAEETPEGPLLWSAHERTKTHMPGDLQDRGEDVVVSRKGHGRFTAICWGIGATLVKRYTAERIISDAQPLPIYLYGLSNLYGLSLSRDQKKCAWWHTL